MARAIDIQTVIEEIQSSLDIPSYSHHDMGFDDGLKYVLDLIEKAPTLTPQNEWVSVEERLPDFDVPVLVYVIDVFDNKGTISITKYTITYDLTNNWLGYENSSFKVTQWMPLPEPPEKEE